MDFGEWNRMAKNA